VLLVVAAGLAVWGDATDRGSFWINMLASAVILLLTFAVGSVAVPYYRASRRSAARRAALTTQHVLLTRPAAALADELDRRYDLDRYVLYPIPPQGEPVLHDDVIYYGEQPLLVDEDRSDDPAERLLRQAKHAARRWRTFHELEFTGASPGSYWLAEALVHLRRCPVVESFPLLEAVDPARLDRIRDLASPQPARTRTPTTRLDSNGDSKAV
jgi:hypothetical protein